MLEVTLDDKGLFIIDWTSKYKKDELSKEEKEINKLSNSLKTLKLLEIDE